MRAGHMWVYESVFCTVDSAWWHLWLRELCEKMMHCVNYVSVFQFTYSLHISCQPHFRIAPFYHAHIFCLSPGCEFICKMYLFICFNLLCMELYCRCTGMCLNQYISVSFPAQSSVLRIGLWDAMNVCVDAMMCLPWRGSESGTSISR